MTFVQYSFHYIQIVKFQVKIKLLPIEVLIKNLWFISCRYTMKTKLQETSLAPHRAIVKKAWYIAYRYTKNTKSQKYDEERFEYPLHKRDLIVTTRCAFDSVTNFTFPASKGPNLVHMNKSGYKTHYNSTVFQQKIIQMQL